MSAVAEGVVEVVLVEGVVVVVPEVVLDVAFDVPEVVLDVAFDVPEVVLVVAVVELFTADKSAVAPVVVVPIDVVDDELLELVPDTVLLGTAEIQSTVMFAPPAFPVLVLSTTLVVFVGLDPGDGANRVYSGKYVPGLWFLPTPKSAGEMLRYFLTCDFDTH